MLPTAQPAAVHELTPALMNRGQRTSRPAGLPLPRTNRSRSGRPVVPGTLVSNLPLADGPLQMSFADEGGLRGLKLSGASRGFIPLAKLDGLTPDEVAGLKAYSQALAGTRFAGSNRSMGRLSRDQRRAALGDKLESLKRLFPGGDPILMRDNILALDFKSPGPEAWLPLWDRLALSEVGRDLGPAWRAGVPHWRSIRGASGILRAAIAVVR